MYQVMLPTDWSKKLPDSVQAFTDQYYYNIPPKTFKRVWDLRIVTLKSMYPIKLELNKFSDGSKKFVSWWGFIAVGRHDLACCINICRQILFHSLGVQLLINLASENCITFNQNWIPRQSVVYLGISHSSHTSTPESSCREMSNVS